ncbi:major facilitator superfamily domain-containing protein [Cadophora sp. MPI-SDFR-AT-0126]|nr:major facilitator superfamily domain-containing protein [Leotiomycetes sp. MPI-SDFR-AT-0126]
MFTTSTTLRYSVLVAVSCMYLGVYWIYDLPSALSTPLQDYLALSNSQYTYLLSALYIAFAVPSIVLPFFSGFAIQKFGARPLLLCCLAAVVSSQLGFCVAEQNKSTTGLVIARVLLGMGGEVLGVLGTEVVTRWFPGDETGLAMAIYESLSSLGSVTNSNATPRLTNAYGPLIAVWVSSILALGLVLGSTAYVLIADVTEGTAGKEEPTKANFIESIRGLPRSFWYIASICLTGYGCLLPFFNSAQRFIASRFYSDDQTMAGLVVSIVHFVGGVMPMFVGLLLEIPAIRNYSLVLLFSQILMLIAHILFLADYGGLILPLSLLAVGNALFSAGIWASVSVSILQTNSPVDLAIELESLFIDGEDDNLAEEELQDGEQRTLGTETLLPVVPYGPVEEGGGLGNVLLMTGYGIITSLMGISIVVTPFFLVAAEGWAGFSGLEMVFVALAGLGVLTSLGLVIKEKRLH